MRSIRIRLDVNNKCKEYRENIRKTKLELEKRREESIRDELESGKINPREY